MGIRTGKPQVTIGRARKALYLSVFSFSCARRSLPAIALLKTRREGASATRRGRGARDEEQEEEAELGAGDGWGGIVGMEV